MKEDFEELTAELLEINHPYVRDLARDSGQVYALLREDSWFFNHIVENLMEEYESIEDAEDALSDY